MTEEMTNVENTTLEDALNEIQNLKRTMVPASELDKVKEDNRTLLKQIVEGRSIEQSSTEDDQPTLEELFNNWNKSHRTDLDQMIATLELREAQIAAGFGDPFIPKGKQYNPDPSDIQRAERTAAGFQHCVDVADGDPVVYIQELTRITADTGRPNINYNYRRN